MCACIIGCRSSYSRTLLTKATAAKVEKRLPRRQDIMHGLTTRAYAHTAPVPLPSGSTAAKAVKAQKTPSAIAGTSPGAIPYRKQQQSQGRRDQTVHEHMVEGHTPVALDLDAAAAVPLAVNVEQPSNVVRGAVLPDGLQAECLDPQILHVGVRHVRAVL